MIKRTRFAPSPTGRMHVGNIRSLILTYLYSLKFNSDFILRIDDTDVERSTEENILCIYDDIKWLGIKYDYSFKQSDRIGLYQSILKKCIDLKLVYPAYDNQDEIIVIQKTLEMQNKAPAYKKHHAQFIENRKVYWRFDIGLEKITFIDKIKGEVCIDLGSISDPVICKPNGLFTYIFASVIDDLEENIDCVIRGNDHLSNTGTQLQMFNQIIQAGIYQHRDINFAHYPLFGEFGSKMSKRNDALSMKILRENFHPLTLMHYINYIGNKAEHTSYNSIEKLAETFDFHNYSCANVLEFRELDLYAWQKKIFAISDYNVLLPWVNLDLSSAWNVIRESVTTKKDIMAWHNIINNNNLSFATVMQSDFIPPNDIENLDLINYTINYFKNKRDAMLFLRHILTGMSHGSKIHDLLNIISNNIILYRLKNYKYIKLSLYNTASRAKEIFLPIDLKVKIYACGPTVYQLPHIGNFRCFIVCDILHRLIIKFYQTIFVRNITDIDDKIIKLCVNEKKNIKDFTNQIINGFHRESKRLNILEPNFEPRVTHYISKILEYIEQMIISNHAYVAEDGIYFKINSIANYDIFKVCGHGFTGNQDFALWKFKDDIGWESKYGKGRPGWHIECTVMSKELLKLPFDIHFGGKDLAFPHHTNECAQNSALGYAKTANYWMHNNFININNDKMSKSVGNVINLTNLEIHPMIIRIAVLLSHYRDEISWNDALIIEASSLYNKWRRIIGENLDQINHNISYEPSYEFLSALSDDLNTVMAFKILDKELNQNKIQQCIEGFNLLGIQFEFEYLNDPNIANLISQRNIYRQQKDFISADRIKQQLLAMCIEIKDAPNNTTWYKTI